jgi:hypothetical protein
MTNFFMWHEHKKNSPAKDRELLRKLPIACKKLVLEKRLHNKCRM